MNMEGQIDIPLLIGILVSMVFSAFFSGMEIAFVSSNRLLAEIDTGKSSLTQRILSRFHAHPNGFVSTMLVGNDGEAVMMANAWPCGDPGVNDGKDVMGTLSGGTFTLRGVGATGAFQWYAERPWNSISSAITNIVVEAGAGGGRSDRVWSSERACVGAGRRRDGGCGRCAAGVLLGGFV